MKEGFSPLSTALQVNIRPYETVTDERNRSIGWIRRFFCKTGMLVVWQLLTQKTGGGGLRMVKCEEGLLFRA
jgi:hypothetical protein